jgi:iron complex outermembrane receptor protein
MNRTRFLSTVSAIAFVAAMTAATAARAQSADSDIETVTVTGTRLSAGFTAPTPVTSVTAAELTAVTPANIAEAIADLPAFKNSANTNRTTGGSPNGTNGQSLLNLRGLGTQRDLILLDGQRNIATNTSGATDVNMMPQSLVKNVEVVTGGASAAYGSDAVSGVVNFILDTGYTGLKGTLQSGISTYGDAGSYKANLTWGQGFLGGKLHVVASGEVFYQNEINFFTQGGRNWVEPGDGLITDPVTGAERILGNIRVANADPGGLITSSTLSGTQFTAAGAPIQHDYGAYPGRPNGVTGGSAYQLGGSNAAFPLQPINPRSRRGNAFVHGDYFLNDNTIVSLEATLGWSNNVQDEYPNYLFGQFNYTIFSGNPYIPAPIQTQMNAGKIASFAFGRREDELPLQQDDATTQMQRYHTAITGKLWGWDYEAHYLHAIAAQDVQVRYINNMRNTYAAADAVINPATGATVCRSQYYNSAGVFVPTGTGLDLGCVPTNLFGAGSLLQSGQAGQNYILGTSARYLLNTQDILDGSIRGDLPDNISLWGGPISAAAGVTYRNEQANQRSDAVSQSTIDCTGVRGCASSVVGRAGGYQTFDPVPFRGNYNVKEAFAEFGVPIVKDVTLAKSLDLNVSGRYARYSTTGQALSWKLGGTWRPIDEVLMRFSQSRDIRAPNMLELFNPRATNAANVIYNGKTTAYTGISFGSTLLKPEKAITTTGGIVYQPTWLPGFNVSVDAYKIFVRDAIGALGGQNIINQCAAGGAAAAQYCNLIVPGATSLTIYNPELNLGYISVTGVDMEASYDTDLWGGRLNLRGIANNLSRYSTDTVGQAPVNSLDTKDARVPWQVNLIANYKIDPWSVTVQERYIGDGRYDASMTPGLNKAGGILEGAFTPHIFYTDATVNYDFVSWEMPMTGFFSITNAFNQNPAWVPGQSTFQQPTNAQLYETMGRYFTAGLRFSL